MTRPFVAKIWPERWVSDDVATAKAHQYTNGRGETVRVRDGALWPGLAASRGPDGRVPDDAQIFANLPGPLAIHSRVARAFDERTARDFTLRTWATARWYDSGKRVYVVDPTTAAALLHTKIDDFPSDLFHLPVDSFYLQVPAEFQWTSTHNDSAPSDLLEGLTVTRWTQPEGRQLVVTMSSVATPKFPDGLVSMIFLAEPAAGTTLKTYIGRAEEGITFLRHDGTEVQGDHLKTMQAETPKIVRYILSTCLYLTSVNPRIVTITPPTKPTSARKGRHKREWNHFERHTSVPVAFVGGPDIGHRSERTDVVGREYGDRKPPRPHVRAGHFKHVWLGHKGGVDRRAEIRWIQPTVVGDWSIIVAWEQVHQQRLRPAVAAENPMAEEVTNG